MEYILNISVHLYLSKWKMSSYARSIFIYDCHSLPLVKVYNAHTVHFIDSIQPYSLWEQAVLFSFLSMYTSWVLYQILSFTFFYPDLFLSQNSVTWINCFLENVDGVNYGIQRLFWRHIYWHHGGNANILRAMLTFWDNTIRVFLV